MSVMVGTCDVIVPSDITATLITDLFCHVVVFVFPRMPLFCQCCAAISLSFPPLAPRRRALHQAPGQSDSVPGQRRPARLRCAGRIGARRAVEEGWREAVWHRPDVHHSGRAALGDIPQVGQSIRRPRLLPALTLGLTFSHTQTH